MLVEWSSQLYPKHIISDNIQETTENESLLLALNCFLLREKTIYALTIPKSLVLAVEF